MRVLVLMLHVTFDSVTREAVRELYPGEEVICINDNLLIGPCHSIPERHRELRIAYCGPQWNATSEYALDGRVIAAPTVSIWVSGLSGEVAMWRTCSLLQSVGRRRVLVGRPNERPTATPCARAAAFWRTWTASTPLPLQQIASHDLWKYFTGFFPRIDGRTLRVSTFDELILKAAGESNWSTPVHMVTRTSLVDELWSWLFNTGDLMLPHRLDEWAARGAVESRPIEAGGLLNAREYRLTEKGRSLVEDGLTSVGGAPPLPIGGCVAYRGERPWVVRKNGRMGKGRDRPT